MPDAPQRMGSLLDEESSSAIGVVRPRASLHTRSRRLQSALIAHIEALWSRPLARRLFMGGSSVAAIALGLAIYLALRPVPKPDYESADISRLFDYTLLTDEFNALPVEERIKLVSQLYARVKDMNASESAMMAAFFAGIAGEARTQLEKNAGKLFIDATDLVAKDYAAVPPEDRAGYLDDAYVRLVRLTAPFDGSIDDKTDEEILKRGQREPPATRRPWRAAK
ncbi:MAG: hypothetical protein IPJ41_01090 [Phycisphaerales bacterium]|nr:hypothetical protein [Phycisphaerales bacterium]